MALKRRSGNRFSANIWPGFVDAMTALLLVLMFVLTIFMIVQFVLRETITGQDKELNQLSQELQGLSAALGLEKRKTRDLEGNVSELSNSLAQSRKTAQDRQALIDTLTITNEKQAAKLTEFESAVSAFESQVATLLAQNSSLDADLQASRSRITVLGGENSSLKARNTQLGAQVAQLNADRNRLTGELNAEARKSKGLIAQNQSLAADIAAGQKTRAELEAQNRQLLAAAEQAAQQNAALSEENRKLAAKTAAQAEDAEALDQQNRQLLADKDALERANLTVITEKEAVQLALAQARDEISESVEKARLAAAKTEALQALLEDVKRDASEKQGSLTDALTALAAAQSTSEDTQAALKQSRAENAKLTGDLAQAREELAGLQATGTSLQGELSGSRQTIAALQGELAQTRTELQTARQDLEAAQAQNRAKGLSEAELRKRIAEMAKGLSETEKAKLAEAAAAAALRAKLKNAQDELTAMTLSLEAERKKAEDTLTLLAAAQAAKQDVAAQASKALSEKQKNAALLAVANSELSKEKALSAESQRKVTLLNQQTVELRKKLDTLQGLLDQSKARDTASKVQIEALGSNLNAALAQVAAEQKKLAKEQKKLADEQRARADLEEKERIRLEAEAKDLKKFRSEFFGRLRDVLGKQDGIRIVGDRFVFSSEILFDPGSADLGPRGQEEIRKVASTLFAVADQIPDGIDWILRVDGHTDNRPLSGLGEYKDNWELSQARALAVVRYLINDLGIPPNRLAANGFGEFQPLVEGDSPEALAQNRRIELKFTEK